MLLNYWLYHIWVFSFCLNRVFSTYSWSIRQLIMSNLALLLTSVLRLCWQREEPMGMIDVLAEKVASFGV